MVRLRGFCLPFKCFTPPDFFQGPPDLPALSPASEYPTILLYTPTLHFWDMATATVTSRKERRKSSASWMKLSKLALRGAKRGQVETSGVLLGNATPCKLLDLPNELIINILSQSGPR